MIMAEATLFSNLSATEEINADSPVPPMNRVKAYRSAGLCALAASDYASPTLQTIPPLLLHLEAEFVICRSTPMKCYLLSSTCIRLMLRLGMHRDPDRLPNITAFSGEMRRRMWHFGLQIEMLVSFQMGLPSITAGIESDTELPRNLTDEDFNEITETLPPGRPDSEQGPLTYFNWKTTLGQAFRQIAVQAHSLAPANDADTMRLGAMLEKVWLRLPSFLKVKPLDECITDDPLLVMERLSICSVYHKGRCVLYRQYLTTLSSESYHNYGRNSCLDAALALMGFQRMHYEATRPGATLYQFTWFLRPIIIGDFLLAAMIVYIALQRIITGKATKKEQPPDERELYGILMQSENIWASLASEDASFRKPAKILATMASKLKENRPFRESIAAKDCGIVFPETEHRPSVTGVHAETSSSVFSIEGQYNDGAVGDFDLNSWLLPVEDQIFDWVSPPNIILDLLK